MLLIQFPDTLAAVPENSLSLLMTRYKNEKYLAGSTKSGNLHRTSGHDLTTYSPSAKSQCAAVYASALSQSEPATPGLKTH